jgi:beta-1,4-N-acetylglucosaminyltransferase
MKILVTVGTSPFDRLIKAIDEQISTQKYDITCQISNGNYIPTNHQYFRFDNAFKLRIQQSDIVITHGGAGTVFQLLEMNKRIIVVPNMDRVDNHQMDLADYIQNNNYGIVCRNTNDMDGCIRHCLSYLPKTYQKTTFFMTQDIIEYFSSE